MKEITLHKQWIIKASIEDVSKIMTDFEKLPKYFPKVAESVQVNKRDGNYLEMEATVKSFGKKFKVKMKTKILPGKGFISDNDSYQFGTSGHEELLLSEHSDGTLIDYTYQVSIHKIWLRIVATPLIRWYSMKFWEKAVIDELKKLLEEPDAAPNRSQTNFLILGAASMICSRIMFWFFDDPEGPNLLIVTVTAAVVYFLSSVIYSFYLSKKHGPKRLTAQIFIQILILTVFYFLLR